MFLQLKFIFHTYENPFNFYITKMISYFLIHLFRSKGESYQKMGIESRLLKTNDDARRCLINWKKCSPFNHGFFEQIRSDLIHDEDDSEYYEDITLKQLGNMLGNMRIIGYWTDRHIADLKNISLHLDCGGFTNLVPRLYFESGSEILYYLEFYPGTDIVILGEHPLNYEAPNSESFKSQSYSTIDYEEYEKALSKSKKTYLEHALSSIGEWETRNL